MSVVLKYAMHNCFSVLGLEYTMQIIHYFVGGMKVNFASFHYTIYAVGWLSAPSFLMFHLWNC